MTLPPQGMMLRGRCFPLPTSARRTCGGECGSSPSMETFPTPLASDAIRVRFKPQILARAFLGREWKGMLAEYVAAFPLPPETPEELAQRQTSRGLRELRAAILFPTPMTRGLRGGRSIAKKLRKMLDAKTITEEEMFEFSRSRTGRLNPEFVEWLMGFPSGWSALGR